MSNDDNGNATSFLSIVINSLLDKLLVHSIEGRCGLVKQQNFRLLQECSGNCDSLFLTARQR
jgi:hypothetical protein